MGRKRPPLDLDRLVADESPPHVFPSNAVDFLVRYLPFELSAPWRVTFAFLFGIVAAFTAALAEVARTIFGVELQPREGGYVEALIVAGRRSGKSAVAACMAVYVAVVEGAEHMRFLAAGQRGYFVIISRTVKQSGEVFRYARAICERNPEISELVEEILESQWGAEIRFKSGVVIAIMTASKASVRGFTIIGAILDEFAWLNTDEDSANADEEIAAAVRYGMLAPTGAPRRRLLTISSPAAKSGVVYETYRKNYGNADAPVLVAHGPTWLWNPSVDRAALEAEQARDPKKYSREVDALFADAVSSWCDGDWINAAANGRTSAPIPPRAHVRYGDGCDMAFTRDSASMAIGHLEATPADAADRTPMFVVDGVWRWTPKPGAPLSARGVVREMATICRRYGVREILGDQFAAIPLADMFADEGITLKEKTATNRSKLECWTALRERFYASKVSLPDLDVLLRELREMEERILPSGAVQIGHPKRAGAHDDCASAVCWLLAACEEVGASATFGTQRFNAPRSMWGGSGFGGSLATWIDAVDAQASEQEREGSNYDAPGDVLDGGVIAWTAPGK